MQALHLSCPQPLMAVETPAAIWLGMKKFLTLQRRVVRPPPSTVSIVYTLFEAWNELERVFRGESWKNIQFYVKVLS